VSEAAPAVLRAAGLTKHFPVRAVGRRKRVVHAVDDVDLELAAGRVVALVGESGSGKSTVARLLAQLIQRTAGVIEFEGRDVVALSGRAFRTWCGQVQMIFQDPFGSLNSIHTVRYILGRAVRIHRPDVRGAAVEAAIADLLTRVQLTPPARYIDKFPHELSGGQRQRIAIARTLAANPRVLLADEPISMLDVSIRLGILNLLRQLRDDLGIAILYITHDIASARYFADDTVVMYAGRIVERGPSEEVTQRPRHPYTQLLIASAPDPDEPLKVTGATGEPPSLIDVPPGCRFHPRCPQALERCRADVPPTADVGAGGHRVACWLYAPETAEAGATR